MTICKYELHERIILTYCVVMIHVGYAFQFRVRTGSLGYVVLMFVIVYYLLINLWLPLHIVYFGTSR